MRPLAATAMLFTALGCGDRTVVFPGDSGGVVEPCFDGWFPDEDGDGHGAQDAEAVTACGTPDGLAPTSGDCDDADADVHPGAVERCNGRDDDCDGETDEGDAAPGTWYVDGDGDGWGAAEHPVVACGGDSGLARAAGDCDDDDVEIHPEAAERCDGADQDCDGDVDEDCAACGARVPEDFATIQAAADAALDGATICVGPGTWHENLVLRDRVLTLTGTAGPETTVLDGGGADSVVALENATVALAGFTLTGGLAAEGGGVRVHGGTIALSDLVVRGCAAGEGGGVFLAEAEAALDGVRIEGCEAGTGGGIAAVDALVRVEQTRVAACAASLGAGIAVRRGSFDLSGVQVVDCEATSGGGGLWAEGAQVHAEQARFEGNRAPGGTGGGVWLAASDWTCEQVGFVDNQAGAGGGCAAEGATLDCARVRFEGNAADPGDGGGLLLDGGSARLRWAAFADDKAGGAGGGLRATDGAWLSLSQGVFVGDRAGEGGGLAATDGATVDLDHVLLASNRADGGGGGALHVAGSATLTLAGGILTDNAASRGAGVALRGQAQARLSATSLHRNLGGATVQADGTAGCLVALTGVSISGTTPGPAVGLTGAVAWDIAWTNTWGDAGGAFVGLGPTGRMGPTTHLDPDYLDTAGAVPLFWDLHLDPASGLRDAGALTLLDPDGGRADVGAWGGPDAASWDLDGDGHPSWWQPSAYDPATYPAQGWDCDDLDPAVGPGAGC